MDKFPAKNYIVSRVEGDGIGLHQTCSPRNVGGSKATPRKSAIKPVPWGVCRRVSWRSCYSSVYKAGATERTWCSSWTLCTHVVLLQGETCRWTKLRSSGELERFALTGFPGCRTVASSPVRSLPADSIGWHISHHKVVLYLRTEAGDFPPTLTPCVRGAKDALR